MWRLSGGLIWGVLALALIEGAGTKPAGGAAPPVATTGAAVPAAVTRPVQHLVTKIPDGVTIRLEARKARYFVGETILLDYVVVRHGERLKFEFYAPPRVVCTDEKGQAAPASTLKWKLCGSGGGTMDAGEPAVYTVPLLRYCQLDKAGTYRVRVAKDLGWTRSDGYMAYYPEIAEGDRRWAETTITLVMPDGGQAKQVVEEMSALPRGLVHEYQNMTGPWELEDFADFAVLRQPVYLPILAERAAGKGGDREALTGIAHIATREATAALVGLLKHPDPDFALAVAGQLNQRLPEPALRREGRRNPFEDEDADPAQMKGLWDPKLAPAVRALACRILQEGSRAGKREIAQEQYGAFILEALGTGEDMPAVAAALDAAAGRVKMSDEDQWPDTYPDTPRQVAMNLVYAARTIVRAGAQRRASLRRRAN